MYIQWNPSNLKHSRRLLDSVTYGRCIILVGLSFNTSQYRIAGTSLKWTSGKTVHLLTSSSTHGNLSVKDNRIPREVPQYRKKISQQRGSTMNRTDRRDKLDWLTCHPRQERPSCRPQQHMQSYVVQRRRFTNGRQTSCNHDVEQSLQHQPNLSLLVSLTLSLFRYRLPRTRVLGKAGTKQKVPACRQLPSPHTERG